MVAYVESLLQAISGAQQLFDWFGSWPSFHDAEVLSIELNRTGPSKLRVHTFRITDKVDESGHHVCDKHCIVTFILNQITVSKLAHFNHQNALSDLGLHLENDEFVFDLAPAYGVEGSIRAREVAIELSPGLPEDSQYKV